MSAASDLKSEIKYTNRSIQAVQVIEELINHAKEFREDAKRNVKMGLSADEIAFYDAVADNDTQLSENWVMKP